MSEGTESQFKIFRTTLLLVGYDSLFAQLTCQIRRTALKFKIPNQ